jgi:hypothetical protein
MSEYSLRLAKPHCDSCHKPKNDSLEPEMVSEIIKIIADDDRNGIIPAEPSLAEKMQMEIHKAQEKEEEI